MKISEFPGCCTARVLFDFGGSSAAMYRERGLTLDELEAEYNKALREKEMDIDLDDLCEEDIDGAIGNAVLVASTTTEQDTANEFLVSKGFLRAGPYAKPKHPETGLYLWWLPLFGVYGEEG